MKDKLEKAFHDALANHEVSYDPKAWESLKKELPTSKAPWYIIGAAAVLVTVLVAYSLSSENQKANEHVASKEKEQVETILPIEKQSNPESENSKTPVDSDKNAVSSASRPVSLTLVASENQNSRKNDLGSETTQKNNQSAQIFDELNEHFNPRNASNSAAVNTHQNEVKDTWQKEIEELEISGLKPFYCSNSEVSLSAINLPANTRAKWIIGNDEVILGSEARFVVRENQEVRLIVEPRDKKHSMTIITKKINVIDAAQPVVDVYSEIVNTKNFITLTNTNSDIEHLVWRFENNVSKNQSTSAYLTTKGTHTYTVESYDKNGCFASVSGLVEVKEDYNLYVENTFTPNNDGINDAFLPEALKLRSVNFKMSIFDKNGKLIYSTTDVFAPWDGTMNGQPMPQDTYVWSVSLINEEGAPEQYRGTIFLDRR